jgi:hypothetical protein
VLDEREFNAITAALREGDALDAAEPHAIAITQLAELARLSPQHAPEMLGRVAAECARVGVKTIDEESAAHRMILAQADECNHRGSLTKW